MRGNVGPRFLTLLLLLLPACTYAGGNSFVFVSSTPAGAQILVDGEDSGETTPARLDLGGYFGSDHEITVQKVGFEPEKRKVNHHRAYYSSKWQEGATTFWFFTVPIFWTFGDFLLPFGVKWSYVPREVHIKLYADGEAPGSSANRIGGSP